MHPNILGTSALVNSNLGYRFGYFDAVEYWTPFRRCQPFGRVFEYNGSTFGSTCVEKAHSNSDIGSRSWRQVGKVLPR